MYTEPYIRALPKPDSVTRCLVRSPTEWLELIRDSSTVIDIGVVSSHPIDRQPITNRRNRKVTYKTNYLFFSPDTELTIQTSDRIEDCAAATLIWFPPGVPYMLYVKGELPQKGKLYRFRFHLLENGIRTTPWNDAELFYDCLWFPDFADRLARERLMPDEYSGENIKQLMLSFAIRLFRAKKDSGSTEALGAAQMRELHIFMIRNISGRPAPSQLAEVVGLSPAYFTKVFVKTTGIAPRRWILEQRIRFSTQLLQEGAMNISDIAYRLGYDEPRLYTRQFSAVFGTSPTAYRKQENPENEERGA